jgi:Bax inhibitor 1
MDLNNLSGLLSSFGNASAFSWDSMMKANDISKPVQQHLSRVYMALFATMTAAAAGVYVNIIYGIQANFLCLMGSMGILMYMHYDHNKEDYLRRTALLCAFGFLKGVGIGSLVDMALYIDPQIVVVGALGTMVVFACFSLSALLAQRRSYLYLGGMISSAMSMIFFASLGNMFFRSAYLQDFSLYAGLIAFSGLVIVDSQMIVEKASQGSRDFAGHAADLFIDFIAVFVRVIIILMKQSQQNREKDRRRRRD